MRHNSVAGSQSMSSPDSSPLVGRVPWDKAIATGPTSSSAPGPPANHFLQSMNRKKKTGTPNGGANLSSERDDIRKTANK